MVVIPFVMAGSTVILAVFSRTGHTDNSTPDPGLCLGCPIVAFGWEN